MLCAQILAATAMDCSCPIYLTMDNFLSMNAFEPLFRMVRGDCPAGLSGTGTSVCGFCSGWPAGIGILNKHSTLLFRTGIFLGIGCVTRQRALATSIAVIWPQARSDRLPDFPAPICLREIANRFPTIEILRHVDRMKQRPCTCCSSSAQQGFLVHPVKARRFASWGSGFFCAAVEAKRFLFSGMDVFIFAVGRAVDSYAGVFIIPMPIFIRCFR